MDKKVKLGTLARNLGVGGYARHVFLCLGDACCPSQVGEQAWDALKQELKDQGLTGVGERACFRTKVGCLRVCEGGPILIVYPEGTWYHSMTADRIPRLVREHLIEGRPIREWIFAENPLSVPTSDE